MSKRGETSHRRRILYLAAIAAGLIGMKLIAESGAGRSISWDELFEAVASIGLLWLIILGVLGQLLFALIAMSTAIYLFRNSSAGHGLAIGLIIFGVVGAAISVVLLGGVLGVVAGLLTVGAGALAWPREPPPFSAFPPDWSPPGAS